MNVQIPFAVNLPPLLEARLAYLRHRAEQGTPRNTLRKLAQYLLVVTERLNLQPERAVTTTQIERAADQWARRRLKHHKIKGGFSRKSKSCFICVAKNWLHFLGLMRASETRPHGFAQLLTSFASYLEREIVWNFERKQIQSIEDLRQRDVSFEIHGSLLVSSDYSGGASRQEVAWDAPRLNNGYPIRLKIAQSDWVKLLDEMKFTHILLHEFPAPVFHPAFARSAQHWREAWDYHRKNEPDSALMACFKAFECLGFELQGATAVTRQQLVKSLLANEPNAKQEAFHDVLEKLTHFMHLGRHAKGHPSRVHRDDAEMILLCAVSLLGYLSKQHTRGRVPRP